MSVSPDVVVIGGGVIGLSTAVELARIGRRVCVISRNVDESASRNAAGMLAANCEQLSSGPMDSLAKISLTMYPDFVQSLEALSNIAVRFVSRNDFLVPFVRGEHLSDDALDAGAARTIEPALGPAVVGAKLVHGDAHIDNRGVLSALQAACRALNVEMRNADVERLQVVSNKVESAILSDGTHVSADAFVAASGAWTHRLLPNVPIRPIRGQMFSVNAKESLSLPTHVLYGRDVYIVPKHRGEQYFIGATVEEAGFERVNTAGGIQEILGAAMELVPALAECAISEFWAGLRPAAPDLLPIIGSGEHDNLTIATGTYRNGMLLAPAIAKLAASHASGNAVSLTPELHGLVDSFSLCRFSEAGSGTRSSTRSDKSSSAVNQPPPQQHQPLQTNDESRSLNNGIAAQNGVEASISENNASRDDSSQATIDSSNNKDNLESMRASVQSALAAEFSEEVKPEKAEISEPTTEEEDDDVDVDNAPILLWEIQPDGTQVPVKPSKRFVRNRGAEFSTPPVGDEASKEATNGVPKPKAEAETVSSQGMGTSDNAYDDVMQYRANAEEKLREGMAKSRSFGRTPSSLENGGAALSLSEEEVRAYDAVLEAAKKEAEEMYWPPKLS